MGEPMLRCLDDGEVEPYNDDNVVTHTSREQLKVEETVKRCYHYVKKAAEVDKEVPKFYRDKHVNYLRKGLMSGLPQSYQSLDSSRPWLTYWIVHSLSLFDDQVTLSHSSDDVVNFLRTCSNPSGGYGGGPCQISHLATTYAAINTLVSLSTNWALGSIDKKQIYNFITQMRQQDGSFTMHHDGEIDVRGVYCAVSVAMMCGYKSDDKIFANTATWILSCQTYEGGFGGTPGNEAHGGYTFCAIAALALLNEAHRCNIKALLRWVTNKQQKLEGGFAGRTNKLVDGCYSFWQGAVLPIIHSLLMKSNPELVPFDKWLFNQRALQEYLLCCCQESHGGLIDKPDRHRDFYHTCYDLSGLSIAQHSMSNELIVGNCDSSKRLVCRLLWISPKMQCNFFSIKLFRILIHYFVILQIPVHPLFNVHIDAIKFAKEFFSD